VIARARVLYYVAVALCAAAIVFAMVGWQRLVAVIALGGVALVSAARTQLGDAREPIDATLRYRLLGLVLIGAVWVVIGVAALT
jgi:hypothetical protein